MGLCCSTCPRKLPWTATRTSCLGRARARSLVAPLLALSGCLSLLDDGCVLGVMMVVVSEQPQDVSVTTIVDLGGPWTQCETLPF